jgi:hypothetical protein
MFQYVFARLHAMHNEINIITHGPIELQTSPVEQYNEPAKRGTITITDEIYYNHRLINGSSIIRLDPNYDYIFSGYFQDAELYNLYCNEIRNFFVLDYPEPVEDTPLVLIRLGDFIHSGVNSEIIHYQWYADIFNVLNKPKRFSISNNGLHRSPSCKDKEEKYLSHLLTKDDTILSSGVDPIAEFLDVMTHKIIVCSNSTWAWWAAFLSRAEKIYTFEDFGSFGTQTIKSHGIHVNKLCNIRDVSITSKGNFINILEL